MGAEPGEARVEAVTPATRDAIIACAAVGVAAVLSLRSCDRPAPPAHSPRAVELHDSVQAQRWADSAALVEYGRTVERARGDSLAALLAARATIWRTRWLPARVDTLIARDTVRDSVLVAGADLRACLLVDSALVVRGDSLAGELVQARFDADQCSEALQARPESCGTWSAFGLGLGAGFSAAAAGCALVR